MAYRARHAFQEAQHPRGVRGRFAVVGTKIEGGGKKAMSKRQLTDAKYLRREQTSIPAAINRPIRKARHGPASVTYYEPGVYNRQDAVVVSRFMDAKYQPWEKVKPGKHYAHKIGDRGHALSRRADYYVIGAQPRPAGYVAGKLAEEKARLLRKQQYARDLMRK